MSSTRGLHRKETSFKLHFHLPMTLPFAKEYSVWVLRVLSFLPVQKLILSKEILRVQSPMTDLFRLFRLKSTKLNFIVDVLFLVSKYSLGLILMCIVHVEIAFKLGPHFIKTGRQKGVR